MPLIFDSRPRARVVLRCPATRTGVVSWNATTAQGSLALRVRFDDESWSRPLPYVSWSQAERLSLGGLDERVHIDIDVIAASAPFTAVEVDSHGALDGVALATPPAPASPSSEPLAPLELDVPPLSQFEGGEQGWCSPASLAMLLRFHGIDASLTTTARAVWDDAYNGTGNWAFNVAYASRFGLRAFVAYLRDLAHARRFLAAGVPLAPSYSWKEGELDGAPLPASDGHIAVLRGFDRNGDPILNDPAHPQIRMLYPRKQLERCWLKHGGVVYVVAKPDAPIVELANA